MSLVLAAIVGAAAFGVDAQFRNSGVERFAQKLALLGTLRKSALESYLATIRAEITFWSVSESLRDVSLQLQQGWVALPGDKARTLQDLYIRDNPFPFGERAGLADARDGSRYSAAHASVHSLAEEFVSARGYYDFFLIDQAGNIVYTVKKETDYATNLLIGEYRETGLANVFRQALADDLGEVHFSDFERYAPSNDAPAIFAARRMTDADGSLIGVMAMQLPTIEIVEIMQFDAGMGESGETYLVGQDSLMRSDSRFNDESTILRTTVNTETVALALDGKRGVAFTLDYRGVEVLSAYDSLNIDDFRWAVMAEIDEAEVRDETSGLGARLAGIATVLYGLALWTMANIGRLVSPSDTDVVGAIPDLDIG